VPCSQHSAPGTLPSQLPWSGFRYLGDLVYGGPDGTVTTFAVVSGVAYPVGYLLQGLGAWALASCRPRSVTSHSRVSGWTVQRPAALQP